jgi:hypothetical protein
MPGPILHVGAVIQCPHAAPAQVVPGAARVLVNGTPAATMANAYPVTGCPFQIPVGAGTKPQPCIRIQWTAPAVRVQAMGAPVIIALSAGLGTSAEGIPQGPAIISAVQPRVIAT